MQFTGFQNPIFRMKTSCCGIRYKPNENLLNLTWTVDLRVSQKSYSSFIEPCAKSSISYMNALCSATSNTLWNEHTKHFAKETY